jgi:DNA polymerase elongation subunit (family B)
MKTDFIPIDYDYFDFEGKNYTKIIGRTSSGKRICIIDSCPVYLWAILDDKVKKGKIPSLTKKIGKIQLDIKGRKTKVEKVELKKKNFLGKQVQALKVYATNYKDLHDIADQLGMKEIINRRGYDLGFITHYIMEKKLTPLTWYEVEGEVLNNSQEFGGIDAALDVDICLKVKSFTPSKTDKPFKPKILAYDIECDEIKIGEGEVLMISLVGDDFKKVITYKKDKETESKLSYVEYVEDEAELLEKFVHYVKEQAPDFLVGYFSDGFDLPYLKARAEKFKVKLGINIDNTQPRFSRGGAFGMTGKTKGLVHLDLFKFIRVAYSQYMESETLSLDEVAKEFLGSSKKSFEHQHSSKLDYKGWQKYYEYNLQDSILVLELFKKAWPDLLAFSRIMQEPIHNTSRNGMSSNVESYILHNLDKYNEIPEKRPTYDEISQRRRRSPYAGAFVLEPTPGLYNDVVMFDFTSYWPSIIVTFNLSKTTLLEKKEKNALEVDLEGEKAYFTKKSGFFPEMLKHIIEQRKLFKKQLKEKPDVIKKARSNAYKLLANSSYGYQGFFGARYYCPEASAAATAISRDFIQKTIKKINKKSFKTIYSDTDSIAFLQNKKPTSEVLSFLQTLNKGLPGIMELELEDFYKRGIWVTTRAGKIGAKKKYALITKDNKVKIRGFETVRRDWCRLSRNLQDQVIRQILMDGNEKAALELLKQTIKNIQKRKIDKKQLVIKTQLKKPIEEYKAISPHVVAAQKMKEQEIPVTQGNLVEYYISETEEKKKLVREKVKLPHEKGEYNIEYYLNRQILPAVENIFQVFDINIKEMMKDGKQKTLGEF